VVAMLDLLEQNALALLARSPVALAGGEQLLGRDVIDGLERIAVRKADLDGLGGKADSEPARHRIAVVAIAAATRRRRDRIAHGIHDQLGPALAPEVRRRLGTVGDAHHFRDFLHARRDAPVRLADTEDRMARSAECDIALD